MSRFLFIVCLLIPLRMSAAVGDITGAEISPSGRSGRIWFSGLNTNGNIVNGFTGSNNVVTPKLKLHIQSPGFNADGSTNLTYRQVFITHILRHPWSNSAAGGPPGPHTNQVATDGNGCIVSFATSEYICNHDTVTLDALAGGYTATNGTGTNSVAITGLAVTNSSTRAYPKALAFPQTVPWQVFGGSQYAVDVMVGDYFAGEGRPVRSVHFWGVDANGNRSPTNIVTNPICDLTKPTPTTVYRGFVWQTNFTAGLAGTNFTNFVKVFPRIGEAASVWDSSDGTYDGNSPYLGPQVFFSNRNGDYSQCFASIDRTNGTANGKVYTNLAQLLANPLPFTNLQTALNATMQTNLILFSKSNWDNCVMLLTNGRHGFTSDPDTPTTTTCLQNPSWVTISNYPGVARADAVICTNRGATSVQKLSKIKFSGITLDWIANAAFDSQGRWAIWWDNCDIKTNEIGNSGAISVNNTNIWMTGCLVGRNRYGWKPSGTPSTKEPLLDRWHLWGNRFTSYLESTAPASFIGNEVLPLTNSPTTIRNDLAGSGFDPWCFSFNRVMRCDASAIPLSIGLNTNVDIGALVAVNLVETSTNGLNPPVDVMQSTLSGERATNILFQYNTLIARYHPPFNHNSNSLEYCEFYQHVGNLIDGFELGLDGSTSGSTSNQDPSRTNRWGLLYGIGSLGNDYGDVANGNSGPESTGGTGNYGFLGLSTALWATNNTGNEFRYTRFAGLVGATTGNGNGDYQLQSHSKIFQTVMPGLVGWIWPYGPRGTDRSAADPPGFEASGQALKAPVF